MESHMEHAPESGNTDMAEHIRTWHGFLKFMKWQVIGIGAILILLAIFRTHG
jgi:hypothetical protein